MGRIGFYRRTGAACYDVRVKKPSFQAFLLAILVVGSLGLAACSKSGTPPEECCGDTKPVVTEPGEAPTLALLKEPADVAPFTVKDLDGKTISSADLRGKVVLVNFWATWCGPCKAEIPGFVELQEKYKNDLVVVGYSVDDSADKARAFAAEYKMNYPILLGLGREDVQDAYGPIWGIPASFLISRDGDVCKKHMGIAPKAVFEKEIKALL